MTKFKGMLLFDVPDPPINNWHESCGGRGMFDLWWFVGEKDNKCDQLEDGKCKLDGEKCSCPNCAYLHNHSQFLMIEPKDDICEIHGDECTCEEVWLGDDETGNCTTVGTYDTYEEALREAKTFMREHPKGWMGYHD